MLRVLQVLLDRNENIDKNDPAWNEVFDNVLTLFGRLGGERLDRARDNRTSTEDVLINQLKSINTKAEYRQEYFGLLLLVGNAHPRLLVEGLRMFSRLISAGEIQETWVLYYWPKMFEKLNHPASSVRIEVLKGIPIWLSKIPNADGPRNTVNELEKTWAAAADGAPGSDSREVVQYFILRHQLGTLPSARGLLDAIATDPSESPEVKPMREMAREYLQSIKDLTKVTRKQNWTGSESTG